MIPWWGWLLIVIFVILPVVGIVLFIATGGKY